MKFRFVKYGILLLFLFLFMFAKQASAAPLGQGSCQALLEEGATLEQQAEYSQALERSQEAQTCYKEKADQTGEAQSASQMGRIYEAQGQYEEAVDHYNEALTIYREIEDRDGEVNTLVSISLIYLGIEQYEQALPYLEQTQALIRELEGQAAEGALINLIGLSYFKLAQYDEALSHYADSLAIFRQVEDRTQETLTLNFIGDIYLARGQYDQAFSHYQQALTIAQEIEDRDQEGTTLKNIAQVYLSWGQYDQALQHLQQALNIWDEENGGEGGGKATILSLIGQVYAKQAEYDQALAYYEQVLAISREIEHRFGEANALNDIGQVYASRGEYESALEHYSQALEIFKQIGDIDRQASVINNIGHVYDNLAQYERALESYQQALEIFDEIDDQAGIGTAFNNIGTTYINKGEYKRALEYLQQALEIQREIGDYAGQATTLNNIGLVYDNLGQYESALQSYEDALQIHQEIGNRAGESVTFNFMGNVYSNLAQYERALDLYQQALKIQQEIGHRSGEATTKNNIGIVYLYLGEYQTALEHYEEALEIFKEIGERAGQSTTLNNIGLVYNNLAEYQKALDYYQQALQIRQEIGDSAGQSTTFNNIGTLYQDLGQLDRALKSYEDALQIAQEIGLRASAATTLHNIGSLYEKLDDFEKALDFYQQALEIEQEIGERAGKGITLRNIGTVYFKREAYEEALDYYEEALQIAQEIGDRASEGRTLKRIGQVYNELGEYETALDKLQQALEISQAVGDRIRQSSTFHQLGATYAALGEINTALTYYKQAIDLVEQVREEITVDEFKSGFTSEHVQLYAEFIDLLVELGRDEEAFHYVQRAKARSFLDQLGNGPLDIRAGVAADLLEKERQLRVQIAAVRGQFVQLSNQNDNNSSNRATINEVEEELSALEGQYEQLLVEIKATSPETASLVSVEVASLEDVQALLDPNTTLVEYFMSDKQTLIFVISADKFELVVSDVSRQEAADQVSRFRSALKLDGVGRKLETATEESQPLYDWFITPIADSLRSNLLIAPHSVLHYLPFSALTNGQEYLLDEVSLVTIPSASTLRFIQDKRKPESGQLLALGNPTSALDALPFAAQEVEGIAQLYDADTLTGEQATEEAIWDKAGQANVIHVAAHGEYNRANPAFSTLHLAAGGDYDGRLEVHEIYGLSLQQANLVVLSACETQLPADDVDKQAISDGDEIVALNRALLYAGTPSVIASLWNVDDEATALLMERFYSHLAEGETSAEALRQAQQELRANQEYAHPYYWAAFVLTGDGGDIPNIVPPPSYEPWHLLLGTLLLMVVGVLGLLGVLGFRMRRRRARATASGVQSTSIRADENPLTTKPLFDADDVELIKNLSAERKNSSSSVGRSARLIKSVTWRKFWFFILAVIVLETLILVALGWYKDAPKTSKNNQPIGFMLDFTPPVDIKHGDGLKEAEIGLELYQNDVVIAQANASAVISISCPEETLVLTVEAQQNLPLDCETAAQQEVIAQLNPQVITSQAPSVVVLPTERSSRQTEMQTPVLLSPRNSLIADTQPTFQWQGVLGASGYRLSLNIPDGENWEVETTDTTLPYPADKAPLPAGSRNIIVKLVTLDDPAEVDETFIDIIDDATLAELSESEANIRQLPVEESAKAYLLAQLYRQQQLNAAAIAQLEQITTQENEEAISADLWQQLGDLYFEIDLHAQAEETYQKALTRAEANNNQLAQAAANFGLGRTAVVFNEDKQALNYLEQAEALYRQSGENGLAEQVVALKEKLEK